MTESHHTREALWKRIKEVWLQVESARSSLKGIAADRNGMPSVDGNYAYRQALRAETLAVRSYLHALQEYRAALSSPPPAMLRRQMMRLRHENDKC